MASHLTLEELRGHGSRAPGGKNPVQISPTGGAATTAPLPAVKWASMC